MTLYQLHARSPLYRDASITIRLLIHIFNDRCVYTMRGKVSGIEVAAKPLVRDNVIS
jgi:hypothetical protein